MPAGVAPYPAAAALQRRAARQEANGEVLPEERRPHQEELPPKEPSISVYGWLSVIAALLAIVAAPMPHSSPLTHPSPASLFIKSEGLSTPQEKTVPKEEHFPQDTLPWKGGIWKELFPPSKRHKQRRPANLFRWMIPSLDSKGGLSSCPSSLKMDLIQNPIMDMCVRLIDPTIRHPRSSWPTDIIDKILTSTPRLLAICNLLLAITWMVHTKVVQWFLGPEAFSFGSTSTRSWAGRERLGGFLIFKLLLISAVVVPDTLDLLILLSWYTLLSFLRSLAHLCSTTTTHTVTSGQPPRPGVWKLLVLVLMADISAAGTCMALFHGAGWYMVCLLTSDCALLGVDVILYLTRHACQVLEEDSNQDVMEYPNAQRLSVLHTFAFLLEILSHLITVGHFCHIWSLHGLQFTLIDGVLALHLHSAISSMGKKIAERRNVHRIARALDGCFDDATELEMRKASATGDVCCICLGSLSGKVKKVACGHLYHTHCLQEVVERARSIEQTKCPLCRASVLDGRFDEGQAPEDGNNNNNAQRQQPQQQPQQAPPPVQANNEHALFRFSTETILPAWLPLPTFSFEVVRRPSVEEQAPPATPPTSSVWRRLLQAMGVIPMSPQEEASALDNLVEMFPQYDRELLRRELRQRNSSEAVVEAILHGVLQPNDAQQT